MADRASLPLAGAVLGIDVGFSPTRRSSAVCRLDWDAHHINWTIRRFRALPDERERVIAAVAGDKLLQAAALDGPLQSGFEVIGRYRTAERILTGSSLASRIGKPGQSNAPVGINLNAAANACAKVVLRQCRIGGASHAIRIDDMAVVEAFPNSFLGLMLKDPSAVIARRGDRSDKFFQRLAQAGTLSRLLSFLLPERETALPLSGITNHDDRAALVCALTALAVAAGDFVAVGDIDGWIVLPPRSFIQDWAWAALEANALASAQGCLYQTPA